MGKIETEEDLLRTIGVAPSEQKYPAKDGRINHTLQKISAYWKQKFLIQPEEKRRFKKVYSGIFNLCSFAGISLGTIDFIQNRKQPFKRKFGRFLKFPLVAVIIGSIFGPIFGVFSVYGNRFAERFEELSKVDFNLRKIGQKRLEEEEELLEQFKKKHPNDDY